VEKVAVTRDTSRNPLFDTMFVLQNIEIAEINVPGLKLSPYPYENKTAKFDLSLTAVEAEKKLLFNLEYCTKLFEEKTANRFITYFKNVVNGVIENKNGRISDFGIITEEEKKRILVDFNNTEAEYPKDKTIHQLFEEQATQTPDYIALHGCMIAWMDGEVARNVSITYRQLNEQSDRLAVLLIDKGVQPDTIVGIMIERSIEMIIGIMGVLKAGGAYLPIDPEYPRERIDYILKDSGAAILLTDEKKTNCQLSIVNTQLLTSEHRVYLQYSSFILNGRPSRGLHHSNLAYVIYTSGSTGKPKGVMIEHQAVHNFIEGITRIIEFKPGKTILALTTITFDIFGLETLLPMCRGLKVVMATENHQREIPLLEQLIIKNCIDMLQATPSRMQMFTMDGIVSTCLRGLKEIMVGGEGFPAKLLQELKRSSSAKIYNMYGPTETTIWSSVSELTKTDAIKVGLPINNTQIYILNKYSKIQPIGIAGELHIGGDGLARGYINRPELTAEKFIPLIPLMAQMTQMKNKNSALRVNFHQSPLTTHLSPLYKTGDLCKWLPNANIEFLGRIDYQVKIRGYRIELGEIENRLLKHEEIKDVVAISKEKIAGDKYIAAYFVSNIELLVAELREFLLKTLPDYMIPSHFVQLEKIPLTSNGKVDRKILDTYEVRIEDRIEYVAPRNSFEKEIAAIWKEELNVEVIGIYDNFFELGGNSLNIIRINNKLKDIYGKAISVLTIFRYPTIHSLSQYMDQENTETRFSDESIKESVQMMVDTALLLMEEDDE
jgi:amino acid adenylation domain-containing protein